MKESEHEKYKVLIPGGWYYTPIELKGWAKVRHIIGWCIAIPLMLYPVTICLIAGFILTYYW